MRIPERIQYELDNTAGHTIIELKFFTDQARKDFCKFRDVKMKHICCMNFA